MGGKHSKIQNIQPGPTSWFAWLENTGSVGWRFQGNATNYYTSIMAYTKGSFYSDGNNASQIPYFSSPLINYQG